MRKLVLCGVLGMSLFAFADDMGQGGSGMAKEKSCGEKIAEWSKYPKQLDKTVTAASEVFDAHAKWLASIKSPEARAEMQTLSNLAREHREMASRARQLAGKLEEARKLKAVEHDMKTMPKDLLASMEKLAQEQRSFGQMLLTGADELEADLKMMRDQGVGGAGLEGQDEKMVEPEPATDDRWIRERERKQIHVPPADQSTLPQQ